MNEMKLWYVRSAEKWEESLPIGNGSLGAMIKGGTDEEILGLNEESLWSGYYKDKNNPGAAAQLEEVRRLIFAGKNKEAERLIQKSMLGEFNESYLPLGSLSLRFSYEGETAAADYRRELDIDHACARVAYSCCGTHYEREYFASYPARAICIRLKADRSAMDFTMSFASELEHTCEAKKGGLEIAGRCPEHVDPSYIPLREDSVVQGTRGESVYGSCPHSGMRRPCGKYRGQDPCKRRIRLCPHSVGGKGAGLTRKCFLRLFEGGAYPGL